MNKEIYRITESQKRKMQYVVGKSTEIVTLSKVLPNKLEKNIADRLESSKENSVLETSVTVLANLARDHKNLYKLIYLSDFRSEKSFLEEREKYQTNKLIIKELIDRYNIDPKRAEGIFERSSLLVHGICTVIATTAMDYSNEQVIRIVNDELIDAGKSEVR